MKTSIHNSRRKLMSATAWIAFPHTTEEKLKDEVASYDVAYDYVKC